MKYAIHILKILSLKIYQGSFLDKVSSSSNFPRTSEFQKQPLRDVLKKRRSEDRYSESLQ